MNTQTIDNNTNHEIDLKMEDFMMHMKQKNADIERDLLILQMAKKLKLADDHRFSYFVKHCKQYSSSLFNEPVHYGLANYMERLKAMVEDINLDPDDLSELKIMGSVLGVVHSLFLDISASSLNEVLKKAFPEYYFVNTSAANE